MKRTAWLACLTWVLATVLVAACAARPQSSGTAGAEDGAAVLADALAAAIDESALPTTR